jgi:spermidine synthase
MHRAYITLFFSAMAGLIYQVTVMDMLFAYFARTSHTSSIVISVFLAGLGIGSYVVHRYRERIGRKDQVLKAMQAVLAVYAFLVFYNLYQIVPSIHPFGLVLLSMLLILFPTILLGASFALVSYIVGEDRNITGKVYSLDLVGAVTGSLISGFVLIPVVGVRTAILVAVGCNVMAAVAMVRRSLVPVAFAVLFLPFALALTGFGGMELVGTTALSTGEDTQSEGGWEYTPRDSAPADREGSAEKFVEHTQYGTVRMVNETLFIDRRDQCSYRYPEDATERRIVDYSLDPVDADRVLNIGLGCGLTIERILEVSNASVDVVEINPAVLEANRLKSNVTRSERVNVTIDDGFLFLDGVEQRYDSIIMDVTNPAAAYSSNLYTLKSFRRVYDALAEDGTFGLWAYRCRKDDDKVYSIIHNTLDEVFPYVYVVDESLVIASKQELDLRSFITIRATRINTLERPVLSTYFGENCDWWREGD